MYTGWEKFTFFCFCFFSNSRKRAFAVGEPKSPSAKYEFFNESNNLLVEVSHGINELQQHEDETENLKNIGTEHLLSMPGSVRHLNRDPSQCLFFFWGGFVFVFFCVLIKSK